MGGAASQKLCNIPLDTRSGMRYIRYMLTEQDIRKAVEDAVKILRDAQLKCKSSGPKSPFISDILFYAKSYLHGFYTSVNNPGSVQQYLNYKKLVGKKIPRVKELQAIAGWYRTEAPQILQSFPTFEKLVEAGVSPKAALDILKKKPLDFKISVDYNDIKRCSSTKHFLSCLRPQGLNGGARLKYLRIPRIAIVFVPDSKGDFLARRFLWANKDGTFSWWRPYGTADWSGVEKAIQKRYPHVKFRDFNEEQNSKYIPDGVYYDASQYSGN